MYFLKTPYCRLIYPQVSINEVKWPIPQSRELMYSPSFNLFWYGASKISLVKIFFAKWYSLAMYKMLDWKLISCCSRLVVSVVFLKLQRGISSPGSLGLKGVSTWGHHSFYIQTKPVPVVPVAPRKSAAHANGLLNLILLHLYFQP